IRKWSDTANNVEPTAATTNNTLWTRRGPVEEDADWYLGSGEGQEVNRGKQAAIVGTASHFSRQPSRHDRIDGPEQIGDVIAEDEWQEDAQDQRPVFDLVAWR